MFPKDKFPRNYLDFEPEQVQGLQDGIEKRFTLAELGRLLLFAGWDWDVNINGDTLRDRVTALVVYLNHQGQLHWLIDLLDQAREDYPAFQTLHDKVTPPLPPRQPGAGGQGAAAAAPAAPTTEPDAAWQMVLLDTDQPFLDRTTFRADCKLVGTANAKRILSVTGGADTGKSYTARYLAGVAKLLSANEPTFITKELHLDLLNGVVQAGASAQIDGLRLANRLSLLITDEPLPDYVTRTVDSEQDTTWAADAVDSIVSRAKDSPTRWIVLDGFETTVLSSSAQALINSLIAQVAMEQKLRIALLGYPGDVSWCESIHRAVLDKVEFADTNRLSEHVFKYLLEVRKAAEQRNRPAFGEVQMLVDAKAVLERIDPSAPDLCALQSALTAVAERVLVGA